jgi:hypothetical protein
MPISSTKPTTRLITRQYLQHLAPTEKHAPQMALILRTTHTIDSPRIEHDMNSFTAASEKEPIQMDKSPRENILSDTDEDDIPLITLYRARRKQHANSRSKQRPNLLKVFPLEIIFLVLDFMTPDEYSGFTCTCRGALALVNQKLETSELCRFHGLIPWTSRTGDYIRVQRSIREMLRDYEIGPSCIGYHVLDESDSDL